ncbi:hypothetical protein LRS12_01070 [Sphingomonas sp. J344]|uniref:hypothetical protein n=1 Tax=Sphingomonas sp. J344 TaxID=2898434 RepID=UPI002151D820|nr:hypothetical protein [Sphingomonas sp. J344]MCR5869467.1 hypothetical protein [Sphingomonas sp. J344]
MTALEHQGAGHLLEREMQRVRLRLSHIDVDIFGDDLGRSHPAQVPGDFLEGIDIPGAEAFDDWLRDERLRIEEIGAALGGLHDAVPPAPALAEGETLERNWDTGKATRELPPKPSLAVLPFDLIAAHAGDQWLCDAVASELAMLLCQYPQIFVISSASARRAAERHDSREAIARLLGVRYLVEGAVTPIEGSGLLGVSVALIDGSTGEQIWGRSFQTPLDRLHFTQEEIARQIAPMIWSRVDSFERNRILRRVGPPIDQYELYWKASSLFRTWERDAIAHANELLQTLLARTASCPWANALAAFCYGVTHFLGLEEDTDTALRRSIRYRQIALANGEDNVEVLGYCAGSIILSGGDINLADRLINRALTIMPSFYPSLFWGDGSISFAAISSARTRASRSRCASTRQPGCKARRCAEWAIARSFAAMPRPRWLTSIRR